MSSPIELGAVIRKVFRVYVDQASVLMPAAAVVFVITGVLTDLIIATKSAGLSLLVLIVDLIATTLFTGMVVELVADVQDGRRDASATALLRAVTPVLGELILVGIVAGVLEAIGFVLILIPGLILMTIWSVVAPVVVIEHPGGLRALGRSRALVRGNAWQVFGVIIVLVLGVVVVSGLLDALAESAGSSVGLVVRVVVGVLTAPISALAAAVLYFELRGGARRDVEPPCRLRADGSAGRARGAAPPPLGPRLSIGARLFAGLRRGSASPASTPPGMSRARSSIWRSSPAESSSSTRRIVYLAPSPAAGSPRARRARVLRTSPGRSRPSGRATRSPWSRSRPGDTTTAGEVAALCAYLASPAGDYFSGCLLEMRHESRHRARAAPLSFARF